MPLIVSTHSLHPAAAELVKGHATLEVAGPTRSDLVDAARAADVIIVRAPVPPEAIAVAPRLKALVRHGAGLDMIPLEAATSAGVLVANVPGVNARSVAEHVLMTTLMLLRRAPQVDALLRSGAWGGARALAEHGQELGHLALGIVGYGAVGQAVAALFAPLAGRIQAYSPRRAPGGGIAASLADVFAASDVVVLCCPLDDETRHLVNRERLAAMRPGAFLVNVSRGAVIDDDALLSALEREAIAGAALDVFAEQPLADDHPYRGLSNVVLTPHVAGLSTDSMAAMSLGAAEEALRVLAGERPVNLVNPEALAAYEARFR